MIVMHAIEFAILKTETINLEDYYKPIGYIASDDDTEDIRLQKGDIDQLKNNKYFDFEDKRRLCSGVFDGITNIDYRGACVAPLLNDFPLNGFHNTDMYIYGTLMDVSYDEENGYGRITILPDAIEEGYSLYIDYYIELKEKLNILLIPELFDDIEEIIDGMTVGSRYFFLCYDDWSYDIKTYESFFTGYYLMKPLDAESDILFYEVSPGEQIDLDLSFNANIHNDIYVLRKHMYHDV